MSSGTVRLPMRDHAASTSQISTATVEKTHPHHRDFLCGTLAAFAEMVVLFPLQKLIFRQQLQGVVVKHALKGLRAEGYALLYRGFLPPLVMKMSSRSVLFGMFEEYQRLLGCPKLHGEGGPHPFTGRHALAAFLAGSTEALLCPLERMQMLLQAPAADSQLRNTAHVVQELRPYGVREFYRGVSPILLRNGLSNIVYFGFRGPISELFAPHKDSHEVRRFAANFASGAVLGATISTVFFPLNVIKTRMQSTYGHREYVGMWRTFAVIWTERNGSLKELYRGVHLNFSRSLLSWGITNSIFELLRTHWPSGGG